MVTNGSVSERGQRSQISVVRNICRLSLPQMESDGMALTHSIANNFQPCYVD